MDTGTGASLAAPLPSRLSLDGQRRSSAENHLQERRQIFLIRRRALIKARFFPVAAPGTPPD
jgi:hypothetical protein